MYLKAGPASPSAKRKPGAPAPIALTAEDVAYIAFARVRLQAAKPVVGPPPTANPWKMAAVGYPLWLWGTGDLKPRRATDSVGGLHVALDAHVSKIVFDMGDGTQVTCRGTGTPWGPWVKTGQASPTCGHTYTEPSLPQGNYTITARTYWSVAWEVTGTTGVIPFVQSASSSLPVGELQVLVR